VILALVEMMVKERLNLLDVQVFSIRHYKMSVIPGAAKQRSGIREAVWRLWIALKSFTSCPAFTGMTKKNLNID
jgi:hypothetical protein